VTLIAVRYYSILKQPWSTIFSLIVVKIVNVPATIALVLCIVGATSASSPTQIASESTVKIGVVLYAVVLVLLAILTVGTCLAKRKTGEGEGLLVFAVMCALLPLSVRLLYSLLSVFSHLSIFNLATGSQTATLFMSVLEEMMVVVIYIATGLKLPAVPEGAADSPKDTMAYRFGRGDFGTGRLGMISVGTAAFQAFKDRQSGGSEELPFGTGSRPAPYQPRR